MTNCKKIYEILKEKELEKTTIEFKESAILTSKEGRHKLAQELIALANTKGGKLIIGLSDDGTFEGKDIFEVDDDKGKINSIIHDKTSPVINYEIEFLQCKDGDLLVINVEKKREIPHACVDRAGSYIKNRIYYIKTPHDKRLVSDNQLKYLFQEEEINIFHPFDIAIHMTIPDLNIIWDYNKPTGFRFLTFDIMQKITEEQNSKIRGESNLITEFFKEALVYSILHSLSQNLRTGWHFKMYPYGHRYGSRDILYDTYFLETLPNPAKDSAFKSVGVNIKEIFKESFTKEFKIPPYTKIEVDLNKGKIPLTITNPSFEIKIFFNFIESGTHMDGGFPYVHLIKLKKRDKTYHIKFRCVFEVNFTFPDEYDEYFEYYIQFAKNIQTILRNEWDYNYFLENQPSPLLYNIDSKLDEIYKKINKGK